LQIITEALGDGANANQAIPQLHKNSQVQMVQDFDKEKLQIITETLENGANANLQVFNEQGVEIGPLPGNPEPWDVRYNATYLAAKGGDVRVMELLRTKSNRPINLNLGATNGDTPLGEAAVGNKFKMVQWFIDHEVDIHFRDENGLAPIHLAAYAGALESLQLLFRAGAHINSVVNGGSWKYYSPLALACERNHLDMIRYLLEHGAYKGEIEVSDPQISQLLNTPLLYTSFWARYRVLVDLVHATEMLKAFKYRNITVTPGGKDLMPLALGSGEDEGMIYLRDPKFGDYWAIVAEDQGVEGSGEAMDVDFESIEETRVRDETVLESNEGQEFHLARCNECEEYKTNLNLRMEELSLHHHCPKKK